MGGLLLQQAHEQSLPVQLAWQPLNVVLVVLLGALGLALVVQGGRGQAQPAWAWAVLGGAVIVAAGRTTLWLGDLTAAKLHVSDAVMYAEMAAEVLLSGKNPYDWDLGGAFALFRSSYALATPTLDGSYTVQLAYPALSFLLHVPFRALGCNGHPALQVTAYLTLLLLLFWGSPRQLRPLVLLPLLVGVDFLNLCLTGSLDIVWVVFIVSMLLAWQRPVWRAVLCGLALAYKQQPWLALPFLLVRLWREPEPTPPLRRLALFIAVSGATFWTFNLPFALWNPAAWLRGISEPLRADMILLGQGLSGLNQFGWLELPKQFFLAAALGVLGLLLWAYQRHYRTLRDTLWILPGIYIWFSYRSLMSYWAFLSLPLLVAIVRQAQAEPPAPLTAPGSQPPASLTAPGPQPPGSPALWRQTALVGGLLLLLLFGAGALYAKHEAPLKLSVIPPYITEGGQVKKLTVRVSNRSARVIRPRFFIQHGTTNPLPWRFISGPTQLAPDTTGTYQILGERVEHRFVAQEGAILVVGDAGGDYSLRGKAYIQPDVSFIWPDAVTNPRFLFWEEGQPSPLVWGLSSSAGSRASVALEPLGGVYALKLSLACSTPEAQRVSLDNWIISPGHPFGVWIYTEGAPGGVADGLQGIELHDGQHRLRYALGRRPRREHTAADEYLEVHRPAKDGWSYLALDLEALYRRAGWRRPAPALVSYRHLRAQLPMVSLRLFFQGSCEGGAQQAYFGPIEQPHSLDKPEPSLVVTEHAGAR